MSLFTPKPYIVIKAEGVLQRYRNGRNLAEIQKDLGVSKPTIFRWLKSINGLTVDDKIEHLKNRKETK
jgi:transposase